MANGIKAIDKGEIFNRFHLDFEESELIIKKFRNSVCKRFKIENF